MRQKYFGIAIAAFATLGSVTAWGGDREIAEQIITRLNKSRESGELKDYSLDMKVDKGVVVFRGNVGKNAQKRIVLEATEGIDGIAKVVDEVTVITPKAMPAAKVVKRQVLTPIAVTEPARTLPVASTAQVAAQPTAQAVAQSTAQSQPTLGQALAKEAKMMRNETRKQTFVPGQIRRTAAFETTSDQKIVSSVISALQHANNSGRLRGFGVDVKSHDGVLQLTGTARSAMQRDQIVRIAESVPGVSGVREAISVPSNVGDTPRLPAPGHSELQPIAGSSLVPLSSPEQMAPPMRPQMQQIPAMAASSPHGMQAQGMQAQTAPYRMPAQQGAPMQAIPVGMGRGHGMGYGRGGPIAGQPVPMAPHSPVGAPRYDSPNLPNYAWPGYSAHPNYASLTYPQQYSPSAWPYIGPFYPYPQVPLGWRKISLEWDDGWWFLDFTDK